MARILIVDDDAIFSAQMSMFMDRLGHECLVAGSFHDGLAEAARAEVDVVFLDVYLPDASGIEGIDRFRRAPSQPEVVVITARSDPDSAERAIHNGAWYYLEKPPAFDTIKLTLTQALEFRRRRRLEEERALVRHDIVGNSPAIKQSLVDLARAAGSGGNVLITGETGTGKELFARALHHNSPRRDNPFVVVDCTNIPETLAESILFGHVRGAFTDAVQQREGMFSLVRGGTMFFDEVGDLPEPQQRSLLRVLQEKRYRPIGASQELDCDFRVVAVTNRDVEGMVKAGIFRRDLYYRLAQFHLHLPPLRERTGDVDHLIAHYLPRLCAEYGYTQKGVSPDLMDSLRRYDWPGNVRELVNILGAAVVSAGDEPVLYPHHLPLEHRVRQAKDALRRPASGPTAVGAPHLPPAASAAPAPDPLADGPLPSLRAWRDAAWDSLEARYLDRLITLSGGDATVALGLADISRARLYQLLKKHGRTLNAGRANGKKPPEKP
ncbi:MAG: sigma-54-dependent transcriptional regulator [Desulfovibrionaceae bacterium]